MIINRISDLIVFKTLKNIKYGFLEIKNFDGEVIIKFEPTASGDTVDFMFFHINN